MSTQKDNKMEINKISVSIISVLITLAISFGSFCYKTGATNNELKNIKESMTKTERDLKADIDKVDEDKANKDIVDIILQKINDISGKLDRLIENKPL